MSDECQLAKTCSGPTFAAFVKEGVSQKYTCYCCAKDVHWVRGFQRLVNGIEYTVKAHFRHTKRSNDVSCCAETIEHHAAKHAIILQAFKYAVECASCCKKIDVHINPGELLSPKVEHRIKINDNDYILDVAFLDDGVVRSAVEVKQTHAIPEAKGTDLTNKGIAWVEVAAREVLEAVKNDSSHLDCLRCAVLVCHECEERDRIAEEAAARTEERQQAEAERAAKLAIVATNPLPENHHLHKVWADVCGVARDIFSFDDATIQNVTELAVKVSLNEEYVEQGSHRLCFGKHRGFSVKYVLLVAKDNGYVRWLANWTGYKGDWGPEEYAGFMSDLPGRLDALNEARELLKATCLLCFEDNLSPSWKQWCAACFRTAVSKNS
jgi:hypothetical protein